MDYYAAKTELAEDLEEFLGISEVRAGIDRVIATGDAAAAAFPPGAQPQMTAEEQSKAYEAVDRLKDQASDIASAVEGYLTSRSREADDVPSGTNMVGKGGPDFRMICSIWPPRALLERSQDTT